MIISLLLARLLERLDGSEMPETEELGTDFYRSAAGYDGRDLGVLDGTHIRVNEPIPELCRWFEDHKGETWT